MNSDFALTETKLDEIASRYGAACLIAMREAISRNNDDQAAADSFLEMRRGIWLGVANELREVGCPETHLSDVLARVVSHATIRCALDGLPTRGSA